MTDQIAKREEGVNFPRGTEYSIVSGVVGGEIGTVPPSPPIEVDGEKEFEVVEILDSRVGHRQLQYLIKWLEYPDMDNEWVTEDHVAGSKDLVELFHRLYPEKASSSQIEHKGRIWLQMD